MKFNKRASVYQPTNFFLSQNLSSDQQYTHVSDSLSRKKSISKKEYLIPGLITLSLAVCCVIYSSKRFFWNDELFSYFFLSDPSFSHMWAAFHDKLNNTPPLYFILGWGWSRLFGSSELSLRLFSSLGMGVACLFTWFTLRRTYGLWPTSLAVALVFCLSTMILSQNVEARMYGLYMAVTAAGIWLYDLINRRQQLSWKILLVNALIQAAIVHAHLFGCLYSGAILAAFILEDLFTKRFRISLYASFIVGWLTFLLYVPALIIQADAGNPRTWIPLPSVRDLMDVLNFSIISMHNVTPLSLIRAAIFLFVASIPGIFWLLHKPAIAMPAPQFERLFPEAKSFRSLLVLAYLFLAIPVAVWLISHTLRPAFWDRYLLPSVLGWPVLFASFFSIIHWKASVYRPLLIKSALYRIVDANIRTGLVMFTGLLLIFPIVYAARIPRQEVPGKYDATFGYKNLPIVVPFSHDFMERIHYASEKDRYYMILDWEVAVDTTSGLIAPQFHKHLDAWERQYPGIFAKNISTTEEFLSQHRQFLVMGFPMDEAKCTLEKKLSNGFCDRWMYMRIAGNPLYKVTKLGDADQRRFFLVEARQ